MHEPENSYYSGPKTDHFNGRIFFNPNGKPPGRFRDLLKWQLFETRAKWPDTYDSPFDDAKPEKRVNV